MNGLRRQVAITVNKKGQQVSHTLGLLSGTSYYTKVIISDCKVSNLQVIHKGKLVAKSEDNVVEFPEYKLQTAEVCFTVNEVSLFGKAVLNIHKYADTVTEFYS